MTSFWDINRFRHFSPIDTLVFSSDETEERFYRADLFGVSVGRNGYQDAGVERAKASILRLRVAERFKTRVDHLFRSSSERAYEFEECESGSWVR